MIEIRSLKPFCPVITTCVPEHVEFALAVCGLTREGVVITAAPRESAEAEAKRDAAEAQERAADAEREMGSLEKELRNALNEASAARFDLDDEKRKIRDLERERDQLRDQLSTINRALLVKAG